VLRAKVYEQERIKTETARRDSRNKQIGTGDRSEKIRTYNYPQVSNENKLYFSCDTKHINIEPCNRSSYQPDTI
jgi:hypothetical protein